MPDLRIVSWNSTGESLAKAGELAAVQPAIAPLHPMHPNVDVYLVQEAHNAPGGPIHAQLTAVGWTINHVAEQPNGGGAGYICATRNASVTVNTPLQLWNYAADPNYLAWPVRLSPLFNALAVAGGTGRPPAYTVLTVGGHVLLLITWHAPLGASGLPIIVGAMPGGGLIDAFLAIDNSQLLQAAALAVAPNPAPTLVIIAGDLNATAAALAATYPPGPGGYAPLDDFNNGYSNHLDHILAWRPAGGILNVLEGHNTASTSVHDIISARVNF